MLITYSDYILQGNHILDNLKKLKALGATSVEMLMDGTCWDDNDDGWDKLVPELIKSGIRLSIHPPSCDTNLTAEMKALRDASFKLYENAILLAHKINAASVVIHPGFTYSYKFDKERAKHNARKALLKLVENGKRLNVRLLVENVGFGHGSLYTQDEYTHLLDDIDPIAGYLIDTGHAHINGWDIPKLINDIAPRLYGFHLHDNSREYDAHLAIGNGTINWEPIFSAMKQLKTECDYIFEYSPKAQLEELNRGREILINALS